MIKCTTYNEDKMATIDNLPTDVNKAYAQGKGITKNYPTGRVPAGAKKVPRDAVSPYDPADKPFSSGNDPFASNTRKSTKAHFSEIPKSEKSSREKCFDPNNTLPGIPELTVRKSLDDTSQKEAVKKTFSTVHSIVQDANKAYVEIRRTNL